MTAFDFSISGQHYLFDVQSFAHTILAAGGDSYSYALRDRTTQGVIDDVANGVSDTKAINRVIDEADGDLRRVKRSVWAMMKGGTR